MDLVPGPVVYGFGVNGPVLSDRAQVCLIPRYQFLDLFDAQGNILSSWSSSRLPRISIRSCQMLTSKPTFTQMSAPVRT